MSKARLDTYKLRSLKNSTSTVYNIEFPELRDALNTKWNVDILEPREGIGAHCRPKDTKMFLQSTSQRKSRIIKAAMEADEDYKRYRAKLEPHLESPTI
jgi:UDP-N-acetyl-D-mannosaminuronic acid dehydrogenase